MTEDIESEVAETFNALSEKFDELCQQRHIAGQAEYGAFTFVGNDVVRMMAEELADTANYCRMQFVKIMYLQEYLEERLKETGNDKGSAPIGMGSFRGTKDVGWQ